MHVGQGKILGSGSHDWEGPLLGHVTHGDWHRLGDPVVLPGGQFAVEPVGQRFSRDTDAVDAGEYQFQLASLGADDQVVAGGGLNEHPFDHPIGHEHDDHQHHAQRNREGGQGAGQCPLSDTLDGDRPQAHGVTSGMSVAAVLNSSSRSIRSNCSATLIE